MHTSIDGNSRPDRMIRAAVVVWMPPAPPRRGAGGAVVSDFNGSDVKIAKLYYFA